MWSTSGAFLYLRHVMPREHPYVLKESSFATPLKCIDVVRQTKTNLDTLEGRSIDDKWNLDGNRILFRSWSGSTRLRILNRRPHNVSSWVDGSLTKTQVISRPEAIFGFKCGDLSPNVIKRVQSGDGILKNPNASCTSDDEHSRYFSRRSLKM